MGSSNAQEIFRAFPHLTESTYRESSPKTTDYNCIAWAVGISNLFMWPNAYSYWPPRCPYEETIDAFTTAFAFYGYKPCENAQYEEGYDKIALYAREDRPKHAARQLANGLWTSKLGSDVDIEHELAGLEGTIYGHVVKYYHRPIH